MNKKQIEQLREYIDYSGDITAIITKGRKLFLTQLPKDRIERGEAMIKIFENKENVVLVKGKREDIIRDMKNRGLAQ